MSAARRVSVAVVCLCACGVESAPPPPPVHAAPMASGVALRVGAVEVPVDSVARIAAAQGLSLARAREVAARDAVFASAALVRRLDEDPAVRAQLSATLARRLLKLLQEDAASAGPVTDEELRIATERHWLELDRPEGFRTVHAVVRLKPDADAATRDRATALAETIRKVVLPARDLALHSERPSSGVDPAAEAFQDAARGVPVEGFEVTVQPLPPVSAFGRCLTTEPQTFDSEFSRAAASLAARGDLSPPITSPFGVHIILLLERIPPLRVPEQERRRLVRDEVVSDRARTALAKLLDELRSGPRVASDSDALLEVVRIEP